MTQLDENQAVGELVLDHSECASVLQRHRIDYCCQGAMSLRAACEKRGLSAEQLLGELSQAIASRGSSGEADPRRMETRSLVQHVVDRHHRYLREALPFAVPLANKVARVHGDHNPKLRALRDGVEELADVLLPHLDHEEKVLFPALMMGSPNPVVIAQELHDMHEDHLGVAQLLARIRQASEDFTVPDWACTSYTTLFRELCALEKDVFTHVHLENQVLMPRFLPQGA